MYDNRCNPITFIDNVKSFLRRLFCKHDWKQESLWGNGWGEHYSFKYCYKCNKRKD